MILFSSHWTNSFLLVISSFISDPSYLQPTDTDISICLLLDDSLPYSSSHFIVLMISPSFQTLLHHYALAKLSAHRIRSRCSTTTKGKMLQMNMSRCLIFPLQLLPEFDITFSINLFLLSPSYKWLEWLTLFFFFYFTFRCLFYGKKISCPWEPSARTTANVYSATAYKFFGFLILLNTCISVHAH